MCLHEILFQIGKNLYGNFSDVATGLWGGLFEPYIMLRVVSAFQIGRTSIEDDPKSGRPSSSTGDDHIEKVGSVIRENRRLTIREVAEEVGVCKSSCNTILTEKLKMHRVAAKFVPRLLTEEQKPNRITVRSY